MCCWTYLHYSGKEDFDVQQSVFYNVLSKLSFPIILQYFKKSDIELYDILCSGLLEKYNIYPLTIIMKSVINRLGCGPAPVRMLKFLISQSQNVNVELKDLDLTGGIKMSYLL